MILVTGVPKRHRLRPYRIRGHDQRRRGAVGIFGAFGDDGASEVDGRVPCRAVRGRGFGVEGAECMPEVVIRMAPPWRAEWQ